MKREQKICRALVFLTIFSACRKEDGGETPVERLEISNYEAPVEDQTLQVRRGRDLWFKATTELHDPIRGIPFISMDMIEILATANRAKRFDNWGLINDPECKTGTVSSFGWDVCPGDGGPEGLWTKIGNPPYRDPACDLNEVDVKVDPLEKRDPCLLQFGTSAGVIGLRKFPNPMFKKGNNEASPFLVGVSCVFCHGGFKAADVPNNSNNPKFAQLHGLAGNQYMTIDHWPAAHRPMSRISMNKKRFKEIVDSFTVIENTKAKAALTNRLADINAYIVTNKTESLAQTTALKLKDLIETKDVGGKEKWNLGKKVYESNCASCHSVSMDVPIKKMNYKVCEQSIPRHVSQLLGRKSIAAPTLKSIWAYTPFLVTGSVGRRYCSSTNKKDCQEKVLTVDGRLKRFELAMTELLDPPSRAMPLAAMNSRTVIETDLGKMTISERMPRNLVLSLDHKKFADSIVPKEGKKTNFKDRRIEFEAKIKDFAKNPKNLQQSLEGFASCSPRSDQGHTFGSELTSAQKSALISYLKTL